MRVTWGRVLDSEPFHMTFSVCRQSVKEIFPSLSSFQWFIIPSTPTIAVPSVKASCSSLCDVAIFPHKDLDVWTAALFMVDEVCVLNQWHHQTMEYHLWKPFCSFLSSEVTIGHPSLGFWFLLGLKHQFWVWRNGGSTWAVVLYSQQSWGYIWARHGLHELWYFSFENMVSKRRWPMLQLGTIDSSCCGPALLLWALGINPLMLSSLHLLPTVSPGCQFAFCKCYCLAWSVLQYEEPRALEPIRGTNVKSLKRLFPHLTSGQTV